MIDSFLITDEISIKEAMRQIDKTAEKVLFVKDKENRLLGSLTDGDIRRWILKEGSLSEKVDMVYKRTPVSMPAGYDIDDARNCMLENKLEGIPVVNDKKEIVDIILWKDVFGHGTSSPKEKVDMPAVIMAGGKGTRLDPFTKILPKALIPIGDKAIIDVIMEKFSVHGILEFYISVNHRAKMIKSYFEEMNSGYRIHYLEEDEPLGTAGSLKLLKGRIKGSFLVSNCDIVIECDYSEITEFHLKNGCDMTIVGSFRHLTIPYGVCDISHGGVLQGLTEKPEYDFLVNTGMCVVRESALDLIPEGKVFHMTDFARRIKEEGGKVYVFPINEKKWIDVGQWEEYRKSAKLFGFE